MTPRRLFIINPNSRQAEPDELCRLIHLHFGSEEYNEVYVSHDPDGLFSRYGESIRNGEYHTVVAAGGDGTIRQCIELIASRWETRLGIIPTGTNNLLAKSLEIPMNPARAMETVLEGHTRTISISTVNNQHFFTISFGIGLDAAIMQSTSKSLKQRLGSLAYWWEGIHHIHTRQYDFHLVIDGNRISTRGKGIVVINRNSFIKAVFPFAAPTDPSDLTFLDICVLHPHTFWEFVNVGWQILFADYYGKIEHYRGQTVEVSCSESVPKHIDGDPFEETEINIRHLRDQLTVLTPRS